jgi:hypothetical protein
VPSEPCRAHPLYSFGRQTGFIASSCATAEVD